MLRFLATLTLSVLANTIGLLAAAYFLEGFEINNESFVIAVVIFSLSMAVLAPLIFSIALKNANFLIGGIALVTTFVGLFITTLISDGISISGLSTWISASLIIWLFSVAANLLLPLILFKKVLASKKQDS